jgi:hypothetical protein
MTGQVKEEILTRFGELGVRVSDGRVRLQPTLLRPQEFLREPGEFRYLDLAGAWQALTVPADGLAFTWCQVPIVYRLVDRGPPTMTVDRGDGSSLALAAPTLPAELSAEIFRRSGHIRRLSLDLPRDLLLRSDSAASED